MDKAIITKIAPYEFDVSYPEIADVLHLNFNPVVDFFHLKGAFCLLHWQSKPFGLRQFGVFCNSSDSYQSIPWNQLEILIPPCPIQVDERFVKSIPVAFLLFRNAWLRKDHYFQVRNQSI